MAERGADGIDLTELEVIRRYSLAVRQPTADAGELVAALRADLAWLEGGRREAPTAPPAAPTRVTTKSPAAPIRVTTTKAPVAPRATTKAPARPTRTPAKKATAANPAGRSRG